MRLLAIGLLLFGRRLPEVGRSLGKGIVEFKKGIKGIEDEIETESSQSKPAQIADATDTVDASAGLVMLTAGGLSGCPPRSPSTTRANGCGPWGTLAPSTRTVHVPAAADCT